MKNSFKKIIVISSFLLICVALNALSVPKLNGRVNDYANIIKQSDEMQLDQLLTNLENTNGTQLVVLTVPSLEGEDIASFSLKVCEKWQLGQKNKDNGILLLVALNEHLVRIETGYGIEAELTDAKCGLIIRNVIIPEFRMGNYSKGILQGVQNIAGIVTDNQELISSNIKNPQKENSEDSVVEILVMLIWIFFMLLLMTRRGFRRRRFFYMPFMGPSPRNFNTNHYNTSHFNNISHFSGGGGHFGGGGASGHW